MKFRSLGLFGLLSAALMTCAHAQAIWKWRDASGQMQISDRAPPPEIPEKNILQRPGGPRSLPVAVPSDEGAASAPAPIASAPTQDRELEARKKRLQDEQAAQKLAKETAAKERLAAAQAENCKRAQIQLKALESGQRMARTNDKGEREVLDDKARTEETSRYREAVQTYCAQ